MSKRLEKLQKEYYELELELASVSDPEERAFLLQCQYDIVAKVCKEASPEEASFFRSSLITYH